MASGIKRVVLGTTDPNPKHRGRAFKHLRRAGIEVVAIDGESSSSRPTSPTGKEASTVRVSGRTSGEKLAAEIIRLNEAFNHWITHRTPFVTVKAAMTLDGKIATASGKSKWITGEKARAYAMKLRLGSDAILVGVNTVLTDDPSLTFRPAQSVKCKARTHSLHRIILDSMARTPPTAKVVNDEHTGSTTVVVGRGAPRRRVAALARRTRVIVAPLVKSKIRGAKSEISLRWLLKKLGSENVTSLLVEGGGEVNASFLFGGLAHRVAFFYAPKILGGRASRKAVAGLGAERLADAVRAAELRWRRLGEDHLVLARLEGGRPSLT